MHITSQATYWDSVAEGKVFTLELDMDKFHSLVPHDAKVLDYGCGSGRLTNFLVTDGYRHAAGVDFSKNMIAEGRKNYSGLNLSVVENNKLAAKDDSYDTVILCAVLTSIPLLNEQAEVLQEIHRVLRPGGILYIIDFFLQDDPRNKARYLEFFEKYGDYGLFENSTGGIVRHHKRDWLATVTKNFAQIDLFYKEHISSQGFTSESFHFIGKCTKA